MHSPGPTGLYFNGQPHQNNSVIDSSAIDNDLDSIFIVDTVVCLTGHFPCCNSDDGGWYSPTGSPLQMRTAPGMFYQRYFRRQSARLYQSVTAPASAEGLFHCQLPDAANVTQYVYIGIYESGTGKHCNMVAWWYEH